jgi:hypothetical protein
MTEFERDSMREHRRVLTGKYAHYCPDWDFMTIDETCPEFEACTCFPSTEKKMIERGQGKYHVEAKRILDEAEASAVFLVVVQGDRGTGCSYLSGDAEVNHKMPFLLEQIAAQMRADGAKG